VRVGERRVYGREGDIVRAGEYSLWVRLGEYISLLGECRRLGEYLRFGEYLGLEEGR